MEEKEGKRTNHDAQTLPIVYDAEAVEKAHKEHLWRPRQASCQIRQYGKHQACANLKWNFQGDVLREESLNAIRAIIVLSVEDVFLHRIDGDILQHTDEVEGAEFLDEADPCLDGFVVVLERGKEENEDYG